MRLNCSDSSLVIFGIIFPLPPFLICPLSFTERSNTSSNMQASPFPKATQTKPSVLGHHLLKVMVLSNHLSDRGPLVGITVAFLMAPHLQTEGGLRSGLRNAIIKQATSPGRGLGRQVT